MLDPDINWPAVVSGALLLVGLIGRSELFGSPPKEPEARAPETLSPDDAIDTDGLAYRGRLVETSPGSGSYRPQD